MPPLTYIHASEAARTTTGGRGLRACDGRAEATANVAADAMQKVCETIGLFNANRNVIENKFVPLHPNIQLKYVFSYGTTNQRNASAEGQGR